MNYELPNLEDLERYTSGQMSAQEVSAFRQRLAVDNAFVAEYELFRTLKAGIKSFHRQRLLEQMTRYEAELPKHTVSFSQRLPLRKFGIAASVAAVLGFGIFMWKQEADKPTSWQTAYIDEPGLPVLMSKHQNAYTRSMNFYRQGQFQEALNSLPATASDTTAFYRGIFWLKLQEPDKAFGYLEPLRSQKTSVFVQKADYYSAMALWQAGKKTEAKAIFETINSDPEHPFHDISATILSKGF